MTKNWNLDGRVVVNWKTCDWQPYPGHCHVIGQPCRKLT